VIFDHPHNAELRMFRMVLIGSPNVADVRALMLLTALDPADLVQARPVLPARQSSGGSCGACTAAVENRQPPSRVRQQCPRTRLAYVHVHLKVYVHRQM
jgi:hypothetical protein